MEDLITPGNRTDIDLEKIEARLGFTFPGVDLEKIEARLGFTFPGVDTEPVTNAAEDPVLTTSATDAIQRPLTLVIPELPGVEQPETAKPRLRSIAKFAGAIAATSLVLLVGLGVRDDSRGRDTYNATVAAAKANQTALPSTTLPAHESSSSTEAPTTTVPVPEAVSFPFENVKVGEEAFRIDSPAICGLSTHVLKINMGQQIQSSEKVSTSLGQQTPLDTMRPIKPEDRQKLCERVATYLDEIKQRTGITVPFRSDRRTVARTSSPLMMDGKPVAAGDVEAVGTYLENSSWAPGKNGNIVVWGHGSTFSAAHGNLGALKPGDLQYIVDEANNMVYEYEYIGFDTIEAANINDISRYTPGIIAQETDLKTGANIDVYDNGYLTQVLCTDRNNVPGRSTMRTAHRSFFTGKTLTLVQYSSIQS